MNNILDSGLYKVYHKVIFTHSLLLIIVILTPEDLKFNCVSTVLSIGQNHTKPLFFPRKHRHLVNKETE